MKRSTAVIFILALSMLMFLPYLNNVYGRVSPDTLPYLGTVNDRYFFVAINHGSRYFLMGTGSYVLYLGTVDGQLMLEFNTLSYMFNVVYMTNHSGYVHIVAVHIEPGWRTVVNMYFKMNGPYHLYRQYLKFDESGHIVISAVEIDIGTITNMT